MSGKKKSKFATALTFLLFLLLIVAAVGAIIKFTSVGDKIEDIINPTFRVEYNGVDYTGGNNTIALPKDGQAKFKVKGVENYKVRVTPNVTPETDFSYDIGNEVYTFGQADLSKFFITDESIKNGYFIIDCTQDLSIESVLSKIHDGAEIKLNDNFYLPYLLTFSGNNETVSFMFGGEIKIGLSETQITF